MGAGALHCSPYMVALRPARSRRPLSARNRTRRRSVRFVARWPTRRFAHLSRDRRDQNLKFFQQNEPLFRKQKKRETTSFLETM